MDPWGHAAWVGMVTHIKKEKLIDIFAVSEHVDTKMRLRRIAVDGLGNEDGKSWRFWFQLLPVYIDLISQKKWLTSNDAFIITVAAGSMLRDSLKRKRWRVHTQECSPDSLGVALSQWQRFTGIPKESTTGGFNKQKKIASACRHSREVKILESQRILNLILQ